HGPAGRRLGHLRSGGDRPGTDLRRAEAGHSVQHLSPPWPAPDADLQPRPGVAAGGRPSGHQRLPLLRLGRMWPQPLQQHRRGARCAGAAVPEQPLPMTPIDLWLLGHGISASPSPRMQEAALRARGGEGSYRIVDVSPEELGGVLDRLRAGEARGANVTIPHKLAVAAACDRLEGDATLTGAVNTVVVEEGRLLGANTDAAGLE